MAVRVLAGAVAGAVALMLWGFAYWVLLGAPGSALRAVPDEAPLVQALRDALPESGVYVFPMPEGAGETAAPADAAALEAYRRRSLAGPLGMIHFTREGREPIAAGTYIAGFLQGFAASLLAAMLLAMALPALLSFGARMAFVLGLGIFAVLAVRLYDPIWWQLPWSHAVHMAAYQGIGWFIAAIVLAAFVRPVSGSGYYFATDASKPLWKRALDVD